MHEQALDECEARVSDAFAKGATLVTGRDRMFELVPYGYVKQACKIAGMKKPGLGLRDNAIETRRSAVGGRVDALAYPMECPGVAEAVEKLISIPDLHVSMKFSKSLIKQNQ